MLYEYLCTDQIISLDFQDREMKLSIVQTKTMKHIKTREVRTVCECFKIDGDFY